MQNFGQGFKVSEQQQNGSSMVSNRIMNNNIKHTANNHGMWISYKYHTAETQQTKWIFWTAHHNSNIGIAVGPYIHVH